jgi:hypothetical protein
MAKQNSVNLDITNNADGFSIAGGSTSRTLGVSGGDITLVGSGSATLTFPTTSTTIAGLGITQTFTVLQQFSGGISASGATFSGNIYAPNIVTSVNGITGAVTNINAATSTITNTNSASTFYPAFVGGTGNTAFYIDAVTTPLSYVPSTGTVNGRIFNGTFGSNTVKLDALNCLVSIADGTNTNAVTSAGLEYIGAIPYYIYTGNQRTFLITQALQISDGDYNQVFGPSTWGYTFPASNGTSGQAMLTNGSGQLYWGNVVNTVNGVTGAITNVAKTNETQTFTLLQNFSAGISAAGGITFANTLQVGQTASFAGISASSTTNTIDIIASTDGAGLRIAQATSGASSRTGAIRLGRASTTAFNTYLENVAGVFTIYNGVGNTGTNLFNIDTTDAQFNVPIAGATFSAAVASDGGYRITSNAINALTGTTYSLLTSDNGKIITWSNASGVTLTVPSGLPVGFNTTVIQIGAGAVGITGSGITLNSFEGKRRTAGQHAAVSIISYSSNVFNVAGGLTG